MTSEIELGTIFGNELISFGLLFIFAIVGGIIASKFKQPTVIGLLLVGAIIGPKALNIVNNEKIVHTMAEFGAILMLFIIGLEFDITKLIKSGVRTLLLGLLKFSVLLFIGFEVSLLLGYSVQIALFIGVILSFSSTVVIIKVLEQKSMVSRKEVPLLIAILIIEDILAVFAITFFTGINNSSSSLISTFEKIILGIFVLIALYLIVIRILKSVVLSIQKNNKDESVLTFISLGMCAFFSYVAYRLGLTPTAGAFVAGSIIASLPNNKEYEKSIHQYSAILTSVFFISMGSLVSFEAIKANFYVIIILLLTVIIAKFIAVGFFTYILANFRNEQPFFSSIAMITIGEFSLLIAQNANKLNLGVDLVSITAALIFISTLIMSISINYSHSIYDSTRNWFSIITKIRLLKMAEFFRRFFDQIEIENHFTKKLSRETKILLLYLIGGIVLFFVYTKIVIFIADKSLKFMFNFMRIIFLIALMYVIYKKLSSIVSTLTTILSNGDLSGNTKKSKRILLYLLMAFVMFFIATMFPFAIFIFKNSGFLNVVPFVLLGIAFYLIRNVAGVITGRRNSTSPVPNIENNNLRFRSVLK